MVRQTFNAQRPMLDAATAIVGQAHRLPICLWQAARLPYNHKWR
jgi:hypothetical protein